MRGAGAGGDGVKFAAANYLLGETEGAQSLGIWDVNIVEVEMEVGGEESCGLRLETKKGELVEVGSKVGGGDSKEVRAFHVLVCDIGVGS